MKTWEWFALGVAAGAAALAFVMIVWAWIRARRRRRRLQERFGPEYFRTVSASGKKRGERRLAEVEREHRTLDLRPLPTVALERYLEEWRQAEVRFVSDPHDAARSAERVVRRVLEERGYPVEGDVEAQTAHIAADHPEVADRYRHGEAMLRDRNGEASTEELRKAILDFRAVLEELLVREPAPAEQKAEVG